MTSFEDSYVDLIPQSMTPHPVLSDLFGTFITSATVERKASLFLAGLVCILNTWHCAAQSWEQRRCSPAHRLLSPARSPPHCWPTLVHLFAAVHSLSPMGGFLICRCLKVAPTQADRKAIVYCKGLGRFYGGLLGMALRNNLPPISYSTQSCACLHIWALGKDMLN